MKIKALVVAMGISLGLAACGGGSDNKPYAETIEVTAIDGYLQNADAKAKCGGDGYTATTDAKGVAKFSVKSGTKGSACEIEVTAKSNGSTFDVDTGKKFGANELYLLTPAGQSGKLVATPFTTLVGMLMKSSADSISLSSAITQIATQYNITEAEVVGDFTSNVETSLKAIALVPYLPKTESSFTDIVGKPAVAQALSTTLQTVNKAVEKEIEVIKNNGGDLNSVIIVVTIDKNGNPETEVVDKESGKPVDPTGGTGGTGTGGTGAGGGTGN